MYMCSMYRVKVASFYWENDSKISYIYIVFHVHVLLKVYIILNVNDITVCLVICLFISFFNCSMLIEVDTSDWQSCSYQLMLTSTNKIVEDGL